MIRKLLTVVALVIVTLVVAGVPVAASAASPPGPRTLRDCPTCPQMVVVPAGRFRMGEDGGEPERYEGPVREVTIAKAFALGRYEVTQAQYAEFVRLSGHRTAGAGCNAVVDGELKAVPGASWRDPGYGRPVRDDEPVACIRWSDAAAYAAWLAGRTGKKYRLPSEAEWEYAARAGAATRYAWGNEIGRNRANCESCGSQWDGKQTAPVGSFPANRFGLHDMHGNVWELVEDCRNESYRGAPADARPWLGGDCARRMMRGGSWNNYHDGLRSAQRESLGANETSYDVGIRLVREIE